MNSLVDTHAHLTFPEFDRDRAEVLSRAWAAGLSSVILVGAGQGVDGNARALELARTDERLFAIVGIHPHDAGAMDGTSAARVEGLAKDEKAVAIGEVGLDYHGGGVGADLQRVCFSRMLDIAVGLGKPVVIHDRDAHEDVWRIIEERLPLKAGGLFHCFSGDVAFARRAVAAGLHISIPGVVTFKNAKGLQGVVADTPLERMVIETDCPFLAPEPHRGKRNEPAFVIEVARRIAEIKGLSLEDVARATTANARRLFRLPAPDDGPRIAYAIRNSLYLNITNRCNLACRFCPKFEGYEVKGHQLKLTSEPSIDEVIEAVGDPSSYDEVVFCGYGEPTLRLDVVKAVAGRLKAAGARRVRLNTDGLANLIYGRDVLPEIEGLIDAASVSLNAADAQSYARHCPSKFGAAAYDGVCAFIAAAKRHIPEVIATVVALPGLDIEACRRKAKELGVDLKVRPYMEMG